MNHPTRRYQQLWSNASRLRSDPKAFVKAYVELQHELAREAREALYVHQLIAPITFDRGAE